MDFTGLSVVAQMVLSVLASKGMQVLSVLAGRLNELNPRVISQKAVVESRIADSVKVKCSWED